MTDVDYVDYYHTFDAKLATNIGEESVSSPIQAVIEMARNAYDADAENLWISVVQQPRPGDAGALKIIFRDDGFAMTSEDLKNKYFRIGTDAKSGKNKTSPVRGRAVVGEKGMGHYAAKRLGSNLKIISNPITYSGREPSQSIGKTITVTLDWNEFKHGMDFGSIKSRGTITERKLDQEPGLTLEISDLREINLWDDKMIKQLKSQLGMLLIPDELKELRGGTIDEFNIFVNGEKVTQDTSGLNTALIRLTATAKYDKAIKRTVIRYNIDKRVKASKETGGYIWDRQETSYPDNTMEYTKEVTKDGNRFGEARLVFYHFPQGGNYWNEQKKIMTRKNIQDFLKKHQGIKIFKDNSRLFPFGEPGHDTLFDWAGIDKATLGKQMAGRIRLATLVGFVFVTDDATIGIKEVATRQGVMETPQFASLKEDFVKEMYDALNTYKGRKEKTKPQVQHRTVADMELEKAKADIQKSDIGAETKVRIMGRLDITQQELKEAEKADATEEQDLMTILEMQRPLATLGLTQLAFDHEMGPKLTAISTYIQNIEEEECLPDNLRQDIKNAKKNITDIQTWRNFLDIYTTALQTTATSKKKREWINLREVLSKLVESLRPVLVIDMKERGEVEVPVEIETGALVKGSDPVAKVYANELSFILIFTNLLVNSIKALRYVHRANPKIQVAFYEENKHLYIRFHDNGKGVPDANKVRIWHPFTSFYPKVGPGSELKGMGLGLTLTKETVEEQYRGNIDLHKTQDDKEDPGNGFATFLIDIPRKELEEKEEKDKPEATLKDAIKKVEELNQNLSKTTEDDVK